MSSLVVICIVLAPAGALAQSATAPPARDVIAELLEEVRGLRQAMERAATVGARIQLLVARVQLQEQRIAELSRRLVSVRSQLADLDQQAADATRQVNSIEASLEAGKVSPNEREDLEAYVKYHKTKVAQTEKRRADLANEESLLMQQVAADQGRWSDVNSQLDDIERSLSAPTR
ncbi:MAG TPA: hypothetical protein VEA16_12070, partial [Vicinamibacterales bacterium]|nr:hypothetical protein [Vicinamibacterales bacterium]